MSDRQTTYPKYDDIDWSKIHNPQIETLQEKLFERLIMPVYRNVNVQLQELVVAGIPIEELVQKYVLLTNLETKGMAMSFTAQLVRRSENGSVFIRSSEGATKRGYTVIPGKLKG